MLLSGSLNSFVDGVLAVFLVVGLNLWIMSRLARIRPLDDARFLATTYQRALLLRMASALLLNIGLRFTDTLLVFWGDSFTYDVGGLLLSLHWWGGLATPPLSSESVSGWGFVYYVAALYSLFGRNQLLVQLLNATVSSLAVLVVYAIAKDLFDRDVARWAGRFMAYFPQMVIWSVGMYKDPLIILCIGLCIYSVLRLGERIEGRFVALYVASALALLTLRFYIFYLAVFATIASFLFAQRRGLFSSIVVYGLLGSVFLGAFSSAIGTEAVEQHVSYFTLERLQITRSDQARWASSGLQDVGDVSTPTGALAALPRGIGILLFAPFPWTLLSVRQALTLPEMLVWYSLLPALLRGLRYTWRHRFRQALPILVFSGVLLVAYAAMQGNIGTAYRQRTQISMFFFIFMGVGIVERRRERQRALERRREIRSRILVAR